MYRIIYKRRATKAMRKLPAGDVKNIMEKMEILAKDPYAAENNIKKLRNRDGFRLRVGNYRVIYNLEDEVLIIEVLEIGHRKEVYR